MDTSTKTSAHTAGPWKIDEAKGLPLAVIADTDDGMGICEGFGAGPEAIANARFIVTACNCHDELLEALRKIEHRTCMGGSDEMTVHSVQGIAIEAIAKATSSL